MIRTDVPEPEGSFGEAHGYCDPRALAFTFDVTCVAHRRDAVFLSILSQLTPSESSKTKQAGYEAAVLRHLREDRGLHGVVGVALVEELLNRQYAIVVLRTDDRDEPRRALDALCALPSGPRVVVAVDDDIDPESPTMVNWAIVCRAQPHRDVRVVRGRPLPFGPLRYVADGVGYDREDSALLIDATRKSAFPPVALPAREHMERARSIWEELGLPSLSPRPPWHGYPLGWWAEENRAEAELAVLGRYYETGEKLRARQRPVPPGTRLADIRGHER